MCLVVYKSVVKRIIDFLGALILLLVLFPVMIIVAIAIKLDSKGPVLFVQKRSGKGNKNTPQNIRRYNRTSIKGRILLQR